MKAASKPCDLKYVTWSFTIELKGETTITTGNEGMSNPRWNNALQTLGKIWKVRLLPNPVGKAGQHSQRLKPAQASVSRRLEKT